MISGIYAITNLVNGKRYIGSSFNVEKRIGTHLWFLSRGRHPNKYLQSSWDKYGKESFIITILSYVPDIEKLLEYEQAWIDGYNPEYNILKIAGSRRGFQVSPGTRLKQSISIKKSHSHHKHTEETRKRISLALTGKHPSEETRKKLSIARRKRRLTPEARRKISEKNKISKLGWKASEETKRKMSQSAKIGWIKRKEKTI
jgi:group I intron endonuclease